jgi:hypothetical protein
VEFIGQVLLFIGVFYGGIALGYRMGRRTAKTETVVVIRDDRGEASVD